MNSQEKLKIVRESMREARNATRRIKKYVGRDYGSKKRKELGNKACVDLTRASCKLLNILDKMDPALLEYNTIITPGLA